MGDLPDDPSLFDLAGLSGGGRFSIIAGGWLVVIDQSIAGEHCVLSLFIRGVLVDRAVVLCPAWDLCQQTERFLFDLLQLAAGTLLAPNECHVRVERLPALAWS